MTGRCDCTNGWLYATPDGWMPCFRCGGTMQIPASGIETEGQDAAERLGAKHESPPGRPNTPLTPSKLT